MTATHDLTIRMMPTPEKDMICIVVKSNKKGQAITNGQLVDAVCEYLLLFDEQMSKIDRELAKRIKQEQGRE